MIIDAHAHNLNPRGIAGAAGNDRGAHGRPAFPRLSDEEVIAPLLAPTFRAASLVDQMREVGTDLQLLSPRPIGMAHHELPPKLVHWNVEDTNTVIARQCKLLPDLFRGVCGLPQSPKEPITAVLPELERCIKELGMVGCLINPDPGEGWFDPPPGMGDEYWYPLYEKLVELDVPALIHPTQFIGREPYTLHFMNEESIAIISLLESRVFMDFPNLKIIVSHGGGSVPYHMGRFIAFYDRPGRRELDAIERFEESIKRIYFDTCLYSRAALRCLMETIPADNLLFGTERPGTGSAMDPITGKSMDDIKPHIDSFDFLSDSDKKKIYEDNARRLYKLEV